MADIDDKKALAKHQAEAKASQEQEPPEPPTVDAKFSIRIEGMEPEAVPDARQIEKWVHIGLERHGHVRASVLAEEA